MIIRRMSATANTVTATNDKGQVREVDLSHMDRKEQAHQIRQTLQFDGRDWLLAK